MLPTNSMDDRLCIRAAAFRVVFLPLLIVACLSSLTASVAAQEAAAIDMAFEADPDERYDYRRTMVNPRLDLALKWGTDSAYTEHPSKYAVFGRFRDEVAIVDLVSTKAVDTYSRSLQMDRAVISYRAHLAGGEHESNKDTVRVVALTGRRMEWNLRVDAKMHSFIGFIREQKAVTAGLFTGNGFGNDSVMVWNVLTGEMMFAVDLPTVPKQNRSEFAAGGTSPGGRYTAVGVDDTIFLIDLNTKEVTGKYTVNVPSFDQNNRDELEVQAVRFSPDGKSLAATSLRGSMPYLTIIDSGEEGVTARTLPLREQQAVNNNMYRSYARQNPETDLQWIPGEEPLILSGGSVIDPDSGERIIGSSIDMSGQAEAGDTFTGRAMDTKHVVSTRQRDRGRARTAVVAVPIPWATIRKNRAELAKGKTMLEFDLPDLTEMKLVTKLQAARPEPWKPGEPPAEVRPQMRAPFAYSQFFIADPSSTHGLITATYFADRRKSDGSPQYNADSVLQKFDLATSTAKQFVMPGGHWLIADATPDYSSVAIRYTKVPNRVDIWSVQDEATHRISFRPNGKDESVNDPPVQVWMLSDHVAAGVGQQGTIYQWDIERGEFTRSHTAPAGTIRAIPSRMGGITQNSAISPDRQVIATLFNNELIVVDAFTGVTLWKVEFEKGVIPRPLVPTFSRDSASVFFLNKVANTDVLQRLDAKTGKLISELPIPLQFLQPVTDDPDSRGFMVYSPNISQWISDRHFLMLGKLVIDSQTNTFTLRIDDSRQTVLPTTDQRLWTARRTAFPGLSHTLIARSDTALLSDMVLQATKQKREYLLHTPAKPGNVMVVNKLSFGSGEWQQAMMRGGEAGVAKHGHRTAGDSRIKLLLVGNASPGALVMEVYNSRLGMWRDDEPVETFSADRLHVSVQLRVDGELFWCMPIDPQPQNSPRNEGESHQQAFTREQWTRLNYAPNAIERSVPGYFFDADAVRQVPHMVWPEIDEERTARELPAPLSAIESVRQR